MVELEFFSLGCSVKNELVVDTVIKKIAKLSHMQSSPCEHHIRGNCANMSLASGHGKLQEKSSGLHEVKGRGLHTKDLCCPCLQSARNHESELKKYQRVSLIRWSWALASLIRV